MTSMILSIKEPKNDEEWYEAGRKVQELLVEAQVLLNNKSPVEAEVASELRIKVVEARMYACTWEEVFYWLVGDLFKLVGTNPTNETWDVIVLTMKKTLERIEDLRRKEEKGAVILQLRPQKDNSTR